MSFLLGLWSPGLSCTLLLLPTSFALPVLSALQTFWSLSGFSNPPLGLEFGALGLAYNLVQIDLSASSLPGPFPPPISLLPFPPRG